MKRKIRAFCLLVAGCVATGTAVAVNAKGEIRILSQKVEEVRDSLRVDILFDLEQFSLGSCRTLMLYPVIEGAKSADCPPVLISGRMDYLERKRLERLNPEALEFPVVSRVIELKKGNTKYHYTCMMPYDYSWMDDAGVYLNEFVFACNGETENHTRRLVSDKISIGERLPAQRYVVKPQVCFVTPQAEAVKDRREKGEAYLDFQAGKSVILPDYKNNPGELQKIRELVSTIKDDKDITLRKIDIRGFASVEGNSAVNMRLSLARANGLKEYLRAAYLFDNRLFSVSAKGEDWDGLARLVTGSGMPDTEKLLGIISSTEGEDRKESRLKALPSYRRISAEMFPLLRRVEYTLDYSVRTFTLEEGRKLVLTRPGLLSLNEMFLVANSYEKGSEAFNWVFDIAVRLYPEDMTARINAAAISLQKGDVQTAAGYLQGLESGEAANNRGVMYLMEGNLEKAGEEFSKAREEGVEVAGHNLEELARKRADDELFERLSYKLK